ncbi:MAG: DctP family TRAP transporter solute-binding subunit [Pseudomonadota bacterium]
MSKFVLRPALALSAMIAFASPAMASCDAGERVIRFSHVVAEKGHPKGEAASALAARINEELDGEVCLEVHPNSSLFADNDEMFAALESGELQMAAPSIAKMGGISRRFQVFDLPFLFEDLESVTRFQSSDLGQRLLDETRSAGILAFTYWHNGLTQFSATRALKRPEDMEGLTFRISGSKVSQAYIETLGGSAKKLKFSQVYDALRTGEVQGQENTWSNIYTKKFYEVQDSITETNHRVIAYAVLGSQAFFDSLPQQQRESVERIIEEVTHEYNRFAFEIGELNKIKAAQNGARINSLSSAARQEWIDALLPVWQTFEGEIGGDLIAAAVSSNRTAGQ